MKVLVYGSRLFGGVVRCLVEDCGHVATLEQPDRVQDAFVEWLERKTT